MDHGSEGVAAEQVSDVWIFSHEPDGWEEALLEGEASVKDGCLAVGGVVVVWHEQRLEYAESLVEEVQAGNAPQARLVGGHHSAVPEVISDSCGTVTEVFLSGADAQRNYKHEKQPGR